MNCCFIAGAGDFCEKSLDIGSSDIVIAADGGYKHLEKIGIKPDIYIGDFDSAPKPVCGKEVEVYNCEKDDTDMLLAVKHGFKLGFGEFKIYGGCGGRADHTFSNIQTLQYIAENGGRGYLFGNREIYTVISSSVSFDESMKGKISVFSLSDKSEGVCEKGLKYNIENAVLTNGFPLGVSNEFIGEKAEISVKKGFLLIIYNRGDY